MNIVTVAIFKCNVRVNVDVALYFWWPCNILALHLAQCMLGSAPASVTVNMIRGLENGWMDGWVYLVNV